MAEKRQPISPIVYLRNVLSFPLVEWQTLTEQEKTWYKEAAIVEMTVLGVAILGRP